MKKCFPTAVLFCLSMAASCFFLVSCTKTGREADLAPVDNLAFSSEWAVISIPYAAFKKEPSSQAEVAAHARRSDLFEICGRRYVTENKETIQWYQFEDGWLPESSVNVYQNQLKAQTAAGSMKE